MTEKILPILIFILIVFQTTAQTFVIHDVLVSAPDASIGDIEIDPFQKRICWQSVDDNKLWICRLDTITWGLVDPYGMETLVDTALTPLELTTNGAEWGFDQNYTYLVYNKQITHKKYIAIASETNLGWLKTTLMDAPHRINAHLTRNPNDSIAAFHYIRSPWSINTKYKFVNDLGNEHAVSSFKDAHWADNEQLLTGILCNDQVGLFDPLNPANPPQLTNDTNHYSQPYMWRAPEHGNARMFFAVTNCKEISVFKERMPNCNQYSLYLKFPSPSSNPDYHTFGSPEPIVYQGQSYITFMVSSSPFENAYVPSEIWIATIDSLAPAYRMISDSATCIRTDPEALPTNDMLLTYYTEVINPTNPEPIFRIRKCETGYGQGTITGVKGSKDLQIIGKTVFPNPFKHRTALQHASGKEHYLLTNSMGKAVWAGRHLEKKDFSDLTAGSYFLKIVSDESTQTIRLIKE